MSMKCIKCTIDEDGFVMNAEPSTKFTEENFEPVGELTHKKNPKTYDFSVDESEFFNEDGEKNCWRSLESICIGRRQ
jgi:hypothetical protein